MTTEPKLEAYLSALDRALGPIPTSDRAEIITEIKSHVLDARERDASATLDHILASLGEPESVASRYLLERGLKPARPARSPIVKWLTIGFLGTFGLACLTTIILFWKFTPLITVDEKNERVTLLGGAIDVDGAQGSIKIGNSFIQEDMEFKKFSGAKEVNPNTTKQVHIPFSNGKFKLEAATDKFLSWECKAATAQHEIEITEKADVLTLDLEDSAGAKCKIKIPAKIATVIHGANGKIEIDRPKGNVDVNLNNGQVKVQAENGAAYRYDLKVTNGATRGFVNEDFAQATPKDIFIKVSVTNGSIKKELIKTE